MRPRCARLLAKPQYFSPPNEVCCWRGAVEELLAGTSVLAGRREDWPGAEVELLARAGAGQGAAAERHLEDDGRGAVAKRLAGRRGEAPSGSNCGRKCQCGSIGKRLLARPLWKSKAASAE